MTHQLYGIDGFFIVYTALWVSACMIAAALYFRDPQAFSISRPDYFRFLFIPWKVATFAIAALGLSLVAPYTGDPTWDYVDAAFMSVMTFVTAPWVVGTIYLFIRRSVGFQSLYVALCLWMFSASWSYDLYLLVRDGSYPFTWLPNLFASSVLYLAAGLLWNLEWRDAEGVVLSCTRPGWPSRPANPAFGKVFWFALPFMAIASGSVGYFLL